MLKPNELSERLVAGIVAAEHFNSALAKLAKPDLPDCAASIPAMTSEAERQAFYRLTLEHANAGAVIELGAWLGASTAYIAAGIRDAGSTMKAQVYDRFRWDPSHERKGAISRDMLGSFKANLGPLLDYVDVHPGEIADMDWDYPESISLIVFDAPKRVKEISQVLIRIAHAVRPGTMMAWQDFSHFASYDIVACLSRLSDHIEFVEAIHPGTTAVFRVMKPWTVKDVTRSALSVNGWTPDEVEARWDEWLPKIPEPTRPRFSCGAAMFLYDIGARDRAIARLRSILATHAEDVVSKWQYFRQHRGDLVNRYSGLFAEIP